MTVIKTDTSAVMAEKERKELIRKDLESAKRDIRSLVMERDNARDSAEYFRSLYQACLDEIEDLRKANRKMHMKLMEH